MPTHGAVAKAKFVSQRLAGDNDYVRGFHHVGEAWYRDNTFGIVYGKERDKERDEVLMGMYHKNGGCKAEMLVRWLKLTTNDSLTPRLEVFDDAWEVLASFADVIEAMATVNNKNISPKSFCDLLLMHGFKDLTERVKIEGNKCLS